MVKLGDTKAYVLDILIPTQKGLVEKSKKAPEQYMKDGVLVEVYFFRSGWTHDGLTTDDEFTPYVFNDGKLVGIGWTGIGGPKPQGQVVPQTIIIQQQGY